MKIFNNRNLFINSWLLVLAYVCFIAFIGYSAARQGLSHYHANIAFRSGSQSVAATAVGFLPENPYAYKTLGEVLLRNKNYSGAAAAFENAIEFSQNDFLLWLRLGYSRSQLKEYEASEIAYNKALELAPNYSQPIYSFGMMLLETGRTEEAFLHLAKAAERDPALYPQVLDLARTAFPHDPLAIERSFNPTSRETKQLVVSYLIEHGFMTDSVRSFLVSEELTGHEKTEFVRFLLEKKNFETAREVWLSRLKPDQFDANELIFDGGFETITENDASGLGWQINQTITATAVTRDLKTFHSGSNSLKVKFAGNVEVGKNIVSQLANVRPGRKYSLRLFALSPEMISAGPPALTVSDGVTNELLAAPIEMRSTGGNWREYKYEFVATATPVVRIGLQRTGCNEIPCPIFGELYLDDFQLAEIGVSEK